MNIQINVNILFYMFVMLNMKYGIIQLVVIWTISNILISILHCLYIGPPPSTKRKPQQDFVEEPHRLLKALPTFDRAGKLIYPNIEDEEPLNFDN